MKQHYYGVTRSPEYLAHYGIKGMKWGVRKAVDNIQRQMMYQTAKHKLNQLKQQIPVDAKTAARSKEYEKVRDKVDYLVNDKTGRYGRGNIDLNKRPVVVNRDGSISTERSFSVNIDGKETLLPTVVNGKIIDEDAAIDHYFKTGEYLGRFDTIKEADDYAEMLHNRQDWYYHRKQKKASGKAKPR